MDSIRAVCGAPHYAPHMEWVPLCKWAVYGLYMDAPSIWDGALGAYGRCMECIWTVYGYKYTAAYGLCVLYMGLYCLYGLYTHCMYTACPFETCMWTVYGRCMPVYDYIGLRELCIDCIRVVCGYIWAVCTVYALTWLYMGCAHYIWTRAEGTPVDSARSPRGARWWSGSPSPPQRICILNLPLEVSY